MTSRFSCLSLALLAASAGLAACTPVQAGRSGLTAAEQYDIRLYVPNADLTDLTPAQVSALSNVLHDGDGFDTSYRIRSILQ
ncbi:MAG: hypothetical protein IPL38_20430 [Rhodobacter sp.]|jgi:hypothetical protein|nr:hypothetical protein [Rhodobacter sp.]MBK8441761.1 hypothetical protein [Rhodobacter sp.]